MQRARRLCVSFRVEPRLGPPGAITHNSNGIFGILSAKHSLAPNSVLPVRKGPEPSLSRGRRP